MLIQFLVRDERSSGWQSGLMTWLGKRKPSFYAYMLPLAEASRRGLTTTVWGQVRPGTGLRRYRLERFSYGRWVPVGPWSVTGPGGSFTRLVRVWPRTRLRAVAPDVDASSATLIVR
jgi:hypothetical protein